MHVFLPCKQAFTMDGRMRLELAKAIKPGRFRLVLRVDFVGRAC
jgi:hypothetical protein